MSIVIAFCSGKEGVGKTTISVNLGYSLSIRNTTVCLFDANSGEITSNLLTGVSPLYTLDDVIHERKTLDEIIIELCPGFSVVSASTSIKKFTDLSARKLELLSYSLDHLEQQFDYLLIDSGSDMDNTMGYLASADYRIIVLTLEPDSLMESFILLANSVEKVKIESIFILVNRVDGYQTSQNVFKRFQQQVKTKLNIKLHYLGYLTDDKNVNRAKHQQIPVVLSYPDSTVSCGLASLADIMIRQFKNQPKPTSFSHFWQISTDKQRKSSGNSSRLTELDTLLNSKQQTEQQLKDLILTLEIIYERRHKQSLRNLNSSIALILAEGDESRMQHLYNAIERSYQRQFTKRINNPIEIIENMIQEDSFSKNDFNHLLQNITMIYQQRFNENFYANSNSLLTQIEKIVSNNA